MSIQIIKKEEYLKLFPSSSLSFMQSAEWAKVKEPLWNAEFLDIDNHPVSVLSRSIPGTNRSFAYIPRLFSDDDFSIQKLSELNEYLNQSKKYSHVDIDFGICNLDLCEEIASVGFSSTGEQLQPQFTNIVDLSIGEEELLKSFKSSTRNKINKASKLGAQVEIFDVGDEAIDRFYDVMKSVVKLTDYVSHSKEYYKKIWDEFSEIKQARIILVSLDGNDFGTYFSLLNNDFQWELFGGMNELGRNIRGSGYYLKWESIKAAIGSGIKSYDQWGVAPLMKDGSYDSGHRFYRIGEFKKEFCGEYVEFIPQQTYVYDPMSYNLFKAGKMVQSIIVKTRKALK